MSDDDVPAGVPKKRSGELSLPATIVGMVLSAGVVGAIFYYTRDFSMLSFEATGTVVGSDFTIEADKCTTGKRKNIQSAQGPSLPLGGVEIKGREGGSVFVDREGKHVVIRPPSCSAKDCEIPLDAQRCRTFAVEVGWTGNRYNNRDVWAGHLRLECAHDDGAIEATLDFPGCA